MSDFRQEIIDAIDKRIDIAIRNMGFDKTYYGVVKSVASTSAVVTISEVDYACQIKDGITLAVGNIVLVKAPNNNFSFIYVDGKLK